MVYRFLYKISSGSAVTRAGKCAIKTVLNEQLAENYTKQLLENFKNEKYVHFLKTIFGALILQI